MCVPLGDQLVRVRDVLAADRLELAPECRGCPAAQIEILVAQGAGIPVVTL